MRLNKVSGGGLCPDGTVDAEFSSWEETESDQWGPSTRLYFTTTEEVNDEDLPFKVSCFAKPSNSPKSRMFQLLKAVGQDPSEWDEDDERWGALENVLDESVGKRVRLTIVHEVSKSDGNTYAKIQAILAPPKPKKRPAPEASNRKKEPDWDDEG